jgi:AbiU2
MAEHLSAIDLKRSYIEVMRGELGEILPLFMQETSRLHLKWNEYEALFNAGPEKVTDMNLAAPGFFWLAQNALWHDIILNVCRITHNGTKVLSVKRLPGMTKIALRDELNALLNRLEGAAAPAREARDRYIAHLEYELLRDPTVQDAVMPERADVLNAIQAIDELLHFVDNHFTKSGPMLWEHLDVMGGASSLHDIIRRGLRDRDERLARDDFTS